MARESLKTQRSILALAREKKLLTEQQLEEMLDPGSMTRPRI
ncbi:MAG: hypothetical protein FWD64_10130 [Acidobacteriaceae bacterium]|nr:hypothetical protein [Acidobacteriaceae bacterium]